MRFPMLLLAMVLAAMQPVSQSEVEVTIVGDDFDVKSARAPERANPRTDNLVQWTVMSSKAKQGTVHTAIVINFILDDKLGQPSIASWQGGDRAEISWSQPRLAIPGNNRYPAVYKTIGVLNLSAKDIAARKVGDKISFKITTDNNYPFVVDVSMADVNATRAAAAKL